MLFGVAHSQNLSQRPKGLCGCRCLRDLPEEQANEVALQLAGLPHLASGSSRALLLSFLKGRVPSLSAAQMSRLDAICLSLHVPEPWRERLSHLLGKRHLSTVSTSDFRLDLSLTYLALPTHLDA